ncbi:MAG: NUDIX domain-containing protein, partial [Salegentibacter sp.]
DTISFIYKAPFDNGLTEHEFDHILVGNFEGEPNLNPEEVADWKWMSLEAIEKDMEKNPSIYTEWFKIIFDKYYAHIKQ